MIPAQPAPMAPNAPVLPIVVKKKITRAVERITPEIAGQYLALNHPKNRKHVRESRVRQWAELMKAGAWAVTHQGIAFDDQGYLIDGQHRLHAVARAGVPVEMEVSRGYSFDTFAVLDRGISRNAADLTGLDTKRVSCLRNLIALEAYNQQPWGIDARVIEERIVDGFPESLEAVMKVVRPGSRVSRRYLQSPAIAALAYAYPIAPAHVQSFAYQVDTGEMLTREDPAYRFREWVDKRSRKDPWDMMMATLQAFHHIIVDGDHKIASLYVGETGYRVITTQRRVRRIQPTPTATVVVSISPGLIV